MAKDNGIEEDARALVAFAEMYLDSHLSAIGGLRPRLVRGGDAPAEMLGDVASYPQMSVGEQVLLIVNDTPSRSRADKGAVVTTWGVHWKTTGGAGSRPWTELAQVGGGYGRLGSRIHLDDQALLLRLLSRDEIGLFLGFVLLVAEGNTDVHPNDPRDPTPMLRLFGTTEGLIPCPRCGKTLQMVGREGTFFCDPCKRSFTPALSKALKETLKKSLKAAAKMKKKQQPKAENARDKQLRKVARSEEDRARKRAALGVVEPQETASEIADALHELGELHAAGVLTDDEFAEKKKELLRRM